MKRISTFVVYLLISLNLFAADNKGVEGNWLGTLSIQGNNLRIVFKITKEADGKLTGIALSPDQTSTEIPISFISFKDNALRIEIQSLYVTYDGKLNKEGTKITGEFNQRGLVYPLVMKRVAKPPSMTRPQDPKKPYPYDAVDVAYENPKAEGVKLAGTLTMPKGEGPFPAVLLITGSGPQNRDEELLGHRPFLVLADYLTRRGIAVLRVDDRGIGKSTGSFATSTSLDFASDALAGVEFLKTRKEIDPKRIGLIGHSEGGLIAPIVATKSKDVAFIVLMAGTGITGEEILYRQSALIAKAGGATDKEITQNHAELKRVYALVKKEKNNEVAEKALRKMLDEDWKKMTPAQKKKAGSDKETLFQAYKVAISPWFRFFLTYDPRPTLKKVKCPVLAIDGSKDLQVPPEINLQEIVKALKAGGNAHYTVKELPGLNHLFQTTKTGSPSEYAVIEETISPKALQVMGDWIVNQTKK